MALNVNVVANYLGLTWTALLGILLVPLYVSFLGIEAYGIIGLFATLQAWLYLFDMGMSQTVIREMARYTSGERDAQSIRNLLRTLEFPVAGLAVVIGALLWAAASYLANNWLQAESLDSETIERALSVVALVVALRLIENLYRNALFGLQRQVWLSGALISVATLRHGGAVAILAWVSPTIDAFFVWQGLVSLLTVLLFAWKVYLSLGSAQHNARFQWAELLSVWRFSVSVALIALLSLLLSQIDKVLLSRLLPLENFGYYALASAVAGVLLLVTGPVTHAYYPRMVELFGNDQQDDLADVYHMGSQLVTLAVGPVSLMLFFFASDILYVWSGDRELVQNSAAILAALSLGTFLNCLTHMAYHLMLACGWTSLVLRVNAVAVVLLIPAIFWVVPRYGAIGAAWIWVGLNLSYVLIAIQLVHVRLLAREKMRWYREDVLLPVAGALAVVVTARWLQPDGVEHRLVGLIFLSIAGVLALFAAAM